jgi:hypothetical protein
MISSMEQLALFEIPWMIPSFAAALVMFTSPPGWPNRANAAGATKMGSEEGKERRVVVGDACETLFNLQGEGIRN